MVSGRVSRVLWVLNDFPSPDPAERRDNTELLVSKSRADITVEPQVGLNPTIQSQYSKISTFISVSLCLEVTLEAFIFCLFPVFPVLKWASLTTDLINVTPLCFFFLPFHPPPFFFCFSHLICSTAIQPDLLLLPLCSLSLHLITANGLFQSSKTFSDVTSSRCLLPLRRPHDAAWMLISRRWTDGWMDGLERGVFSKQLCF